VDNSESLTKIGGILFLSIFLFFLITGNMVGYYTYSHWNRLINFQLINFLDVKKYLHFLEILDKIGIFDKNSGQNKKFWSKNRNFGLKDGILLKKSKFWSKWKILSK